VGTVRDGNPRGRMTEVLPEPEMAGPGKRRTSSGCGGGPCRTRSAAPAGEKHPVLDFLFTYYSHRPTHLERWQPGPGVALAGPRARRFLERKGYVETADGVVLDPSRVHPPARRGPPMFVLDLLSATASRAPRLSCFGLHEWAMVYQEPSDSVRHNQVPLRLGSAGTDAVVESLDIKCGHFDAFRFSPTPPGPATSSSRRGRRSSTWSSPAACTPTWTCSSGPTSSTRFVPAELVGDCFALAAEHS